MSQYFNLEGKRISESDYNNILQALLDSWDGVPESERHDDVKDIRQYSNGKLKITLSWNGILGDDITDNYYPSDFPLFKLKVANLINGEWVQEPISPTYAKYSRANTAYEDWLMRYSPSFYDENGEFIVEGNLLKPHNAMTPEFKQAKAIALKPKTSSAMVSNIEW